jgi:hypothetical protein
MRCGAGAAAAARHAYFQGAEAAHRLPCGVASFVWRTLRVRFQMRRCCAVLCGAGTAQAMVTWPVVISQLFLLVPPIPSLTFPQLTHG